MKLPAACFLLVCLVSPLLAAERALVTPALWEHSIVTIEVTSKQYDYYQPWNQRSGRATKAGIVAGSGQIVTEAEHLSNQTLIRIQKNGRGKWWIGKLLWVDYPANLAMMTVDDPAFWNDLRPVQFSSGMPADGSLQIIKWNGGVLETGQAAFTRFVVQESKTSTVSYVQLKANADMDGLGWGEPIVFGSNVVGIVTSKSANDCTAIPASFLQSIVAAHQGTNRGLGYFHFYWQPAENITSLEDLGLQGEPRGVLVTRVPARLDGTAAVLKPKDVLLQIDGFDIDIEGDYNDPQYGFLMLEYLATRNKWAGDAVPLKILRGGKEMSVTYTLPRYEYTDWLVPSQSYDQEPAYFIMGGLVFQPLTCDYLRIWGNDWRRRAPFRLGYYTSDEATAEQPTLVILSNVLPDSYNIGYQEQRGLVLEKVNGQPIKRLTDLRDAFKTPLGEYHVIEFKKGGDLRRMVLAAGSEEQAASSRILERYGINRPFRFTPPRTMAGNAP